MKSQQRILQNLMDAIWLTDKITGKNIRIAYVVPKEVIEKSKKLLDRNPRYTAVVLYKETAKVKKVI